MKRETTRTNDFPLFKSNRLAKNSIFFLLFQNIWKSKRKLLSCQQVLSSRNFTIQLDRSREKRRQHESSLSNDDVCMILWAQKCTWTQENSIESETEFSVSFESFKWNKRMEFKRRIEWWKLREATPRRKKKNRATACCFSSNIMVYCRSCIMCSSERKERRRNKLWNGRNNSTEYDANNFILSRNNKRLDRIAFRWYYFSFLLFTRRSFRHGTNFWIQSALSAREPWQHDVQSMGRQKQ